MRANDPPFIRLALLTSIAASLAMMSAKVLLYRPLLAIPGGRGYVFGTAGLFALYGFLVLWATRSDGPLRRAALLLGTPLGVIAGAIQIAHLAQEEFMDLGRAAAPRDTFPLPAQSLASTSRSSDSVGPATPVDRAVAGSPTGLTGTPLVVPVQPPAITASCSVGLR
jgi:hypothetical protein